MQEPAKDLFGLALIKQLDALKAIFVIL